MNSPNPTPTPVKPSGSTYGSGIGGALALIVISIIGAFHVTVTPELASAITLVCAAVAGYIPSSGRSA